MMSNKDRKMFIELLTGKKIKINYELLCLSEYGFVYFKNVNDQIEIIVPYDIAFIVEDLFL